MEKRVQGKVVYFPTRLPPAPPPAPERRPWAYFGMGILCSILAVYFFYLGLK